MSRRFAFACLVALLLTACTPVEDEPDSAAAGMSGQVMNDVPAEIRPEHHYLFYLHGQIIEDQGVRPEHPEFGVYEYQAVLDALAAEGFEVISEPRPPRTDGKAYAEKVVKQIERLLSAGVPAERVAVVGFSKGGGIAVAVASMLGNESVRFAFLGTCATRITNRPQLELKGRILSIYEASDPIAGSCEEMFSESVVVPEFRELKVRLGGGHGAFYRPASEWIGPVVAWLRGESL
jgi:predicted esterase